MKPLTADQLDGMQCSTPGCNCGAHDGEMFIHAKCHPSADMEVCYHFTTGQMDIICADCKKLVVSVAVSGCESKFDPWEQEV